MPVKIIEAFIKKTRLFLLGDIKMVNKKIETKKAPKKVIKFNELTSLKIKHDCLIDKHNDLVYRFNKIPKFIRKIFK